MMVAASKMEGGEIDYMSLPSKAERRDNRNNDDNYSIQQSGCY
jgi:phage FluMu gp28-like protein